MNRPSASADGKRVAFLESSGRTGTNMTNLEVGGTRLANSRLFIVEHGGEDGIYDWTADSKTVLLALDRGDRYALHKQSLNSESQEAIVTSVPGLVEYAAVSPDEKWVIAQVEPMPGRSPSAPVQLMRVPMTGGSPELLFSMPEWSSSLCAKLPSRLCAVAEQSEDHKKMVITSFDPVKGPGPELARFDLSPEYETTMLNLLWSISFDGTRLAAAGGPEGPIEIRSLVGGPGKVIRPRGLSKMKLLQWAADDNGLFISNITSGGIEIVHVDLQGDAKVLWKSNTDRCLGIPSPDGRHLAIYDWKQNANMWMMENF